MSPVHLIYSCLDVANKLMYYPLKLIRTTGKRWRQPDNFMHKAYLNCIGVNNRYFYCRNRPFKGPAGVKGLSCSLGCGCNFC